MRKVGRLRYILAWIWRCGGRREKGWRRDEGCADENRGLRCAEFAEGVYCGAGGGMKGGVDGDEILAAFQEDFDADISDDDDGE
jgi:hypothetical protein